jgi:acyl transferase domain-containing protein
MEGRCAVSEVPEDRWSKAKHGHPRPKEPGKSYTWAAGVLDDVWGFDPGVFGISPREAEQMDPHQRLMLELTWEALEDAGIKRSTLAGGDVGVFVGASSPEYTNIRTSDMAAGDAYTATGGALSIISNRISHAFDLKGPSFTVDTACSSSLVALHQAMLALRSGEIDTAIVGGVNLLLSPFGFVVFSQASMLSPTGLCQTFDAKADGYVRAEGAVVLILKTAKQAAKDDSRVYARVVASGVNSDGRTNGIALPSKFSQAKLLRELYGDAGIAPSQLAFVEAHGTGTRVGDPIEAGTIGEVLGQGRPEPLRIGSVKSNIGHLEPASGLAGMLKAMLALEHDMLPASINFDEPNPDIPFDDLNLEVCTRATPLPRRNGARYAGINSFGFGGTNAHVIIADPVAASARPKRYVSQSDLFAVSGASRSAVRDLARRYADQLATASSGVVQEVAAATAHRRELLGERLVVDWKSPRDLVRKLERVADREEDVPGATWGTVTDSDAKVAFVFSGNGGQWPGMGRAVYGANRHFREAFDEVDALFDAEFGWSVTEALFANDLDQRLPFTHVAQPLIFAIQIATARALGAEGLSPSMVLGHSVGEIAAAAASGALSLRDAVKVIHARSVHQELARDAGRMAVVVGSQEQVQALADEVGGVEIAAFNSPRTFTVAGSTESVKALGLRARKRRMVFRQLDLDYPFHCGLVEAVRDPLLKDLDGLRASPTRIDMVSTVTGERIEGQSLDPAYWWRNVREPVRFASAVEVAARMGARVFVEIGPRSVLLSNIAETIEPTSLPFAAMGVLERREEPEEGDPIRPAVVGAFVRGAAIDLERLFGPEPNRPVALPTYGWQRRSFAMSSSSEAVGSTLNTAWHRLLGARNTADGVEWKGQLDTAAVPELADHQVGDSAILPGAAFIEMALSAAREWFGVETAALLDLDIVQPLALEYDRTREICARLSPTTNTLEILSRARLSRAAWQLHAIAKLTQGSEDPVETTLPAPLGELVSAEAIYTAASAVGLVYGPAFRLLRNVRRVAPRTLLVELESSAPEGEYRIDPAPLDASFHGLFALLRELGAERRGTAFIPVRFGHVRVTKPGVAPTHAVIELGKVGERSIVADFTLFDAAGEVVAQLAEARFQAARVRRTNLLADRALELDWVPADAGSLQRPGLASSSAEVLGLAERLGLLASEDESDTPEQILLEGWATAASYEIARTLEHDGTIAPEIISSLSPRVAAWVSNLLHVLEASGLAEVSEQGWRLAGASSLPTAEAILRTLAAENANRSAELLIAGGLTAFPRRAEWTHDADPSPSASALEGYELAGASGRASGEVVEALLVEGALLAGTGAGVRVLQVGFGRSLMRCPSWLADMAPGSPFSTPIRGASSGQSSPWERAPTSRSRLRATPSMAAATI